MYAQEVLAWAMNSDVLLIDLSMLDEIFLSSCLPVLHVSFMKQATESLNKFSNNGEQKNRLTNVQ